MDIRTKEGAALARRIGQLGEELAAQYLLSRGYEILERNYRCRYGEIDIIAARNGQLSFVEVKTRSDVRRMQPVEAVDRQKQKRLRLTAARYLVDKRMEWGDTPPYTGMEFQVVEVQIGQHGGLDMRG